METLLQLPSAWKAQPMGRNAVSCFERNRAGCELRSRLLIWIWISICIWIWFWIWMSICVEHWPAYEFEYQHWSELQYECEEQTEHEDVIIMNMNQSNNMSCTTNQLTLNTSCNINTNLNIIWRRTMKCEINRLHQRRNCTGHMWDYTNNMTGQEAVKKWSNKH